MVRTECLSPELSVIIVTWNSAGEILGCLDSVCGQPGDFMLEVVVIDNASQDSTVRLIREHHPHTPVLANQRNLGFAAANNLGIERAKGRHVLLLNPDTIVKEQALSIMLGYLDTHSQVGAVGPRLIRANGQVQHSCTRFPSLWANLSGHLSGGGYIPKHTRAPSPVQALSGAALMVKREAIDEVGLLDTDYFMYGEDTDWCFRLQQAGWAVHYLPQAEVLHFGGQSARLVPVQTYVRRRIARLIFVRKHRSRWEARLLAALVRLHINLHRLSTRGETRRYYDDVRRTYDQRIREIG